MMQINTIENYIHTTKLDLNLSTITDSCYKMCDFINLNFANKKFDTDYDGLASSTTIPFAQYNLLLYPLPEFHALFKDIQKIFHEVNDQPNEKFYMQCWLNFYRKGEYIDWHDHWPSDFKAWHGFYCVSGKGSYTSYKLPPNHEKEIIIPTILNQLVLSKSDGDLHRSSDWNEDYPRITIAFDMVPGVRLFPFGNVNHWIPI